MPTLRLLNDREGGRAWPQWHAVAGLPYAGSADSLVVPDPNVRVQAVIDGQGAAINDDLVAPEIAAGRLGRLSEHELGDRGYFLAYAKGALDRPEVAAFRDWAVAEAAGDPRPVY